MGVSFVIGRAGSGKTRYCVDALLRDLAREGDERPLILLVPEQASFQMERTLALRCPRGGYWRAEVLSFSRLARRVFDTCGGAPETLNAGARALALRVVAGKDPNAVSAFGKAARTHGFYTSLDRLIGELFTENVSPEQLRAAAGRLDNDATRARVEAIASLYSTYVRWLGADRIDPDQRLAVLRSRLAEATWLHDARVWVDGFASFTGQELETLVALARTAQDLTLSLMFDGTASSDSEVRGHGTSASSDSEVRGDGADSGADAATDSLRLFHRIEATYQQLRRRFCDEGVAINPAITLGKTSPRFAKSPQLARLEHGLAGDPTPTDQSSPGQPTEAAAVRVMACETHRAELEQAARFIRRQVITSGGKQRFRDFAVIARDLAPFTNLVDDVFSRYEIPYFLDRRRPLAAHALSRFVAGLLDCIAQDLAPGPVIRLLRSGLLPLRRAQAETLEAIVSEHEVRGAATWREPGWRFGRQQARRRDHESASDGFDAWAAARQGIVDAIEPLIELHRSEAPASGARWARAVGETLAGLKIDQRIGEWIAQADRQSQPESAAVHRAAWESLCAVLEDFDRVLADTPLDGAEFAAALRATLREQTVGLAPPTLDQVLVSSIDRSRHPEIKWAWVFGVNEGLFPARPSDDVLLSAAQRVELNAAGAAAPKPKRDDALAEPLLFYIALTRASAGVVISYAKVDGDGEEMFESPLLANVRRILPGLAIERPPNDEMPVCRWEFARGYLDTHAERISTARGRWYHALRGRLSRTLADAAEFDRMLRGLAFQNVCGSAPGYAMRDELDEGVVWRGSASGLETYLQCPFKHFVRYGLRLRDRRGPTPLRMDLGNAAHEILAATFATVIRSGDDVSRLDNDAWLDHLRAAAKQYESRQPTDLMRRRPQAGYLARLLYQRLEDTVLAHAARYRLGLWRPLAVECAFGREPAPECANAGGESPRSLAPLEIALDKGRRAQFTGFIDRIDVEASGSRPRHLVYDYKSTVSSPTGEYLLDDMLALFLYSLAVEQGLGAEGQGARVRGGLLAPLYLEFNDSNYVQEADLDSQRMQMFKPRGRFDERIATVLHRNLGSAPSPVARMRLLKKGGFYKNSDAKPSSEIDRLFELARRTVVQAATGIADGLIDVSPLVVKKKLACLYCEYRPVCRYEPRLNRARPVSVALPQLRDVQRDVATAAREDGV
jgi:ATP-dependent helicase/nuclease subunit B